MIIYKIVNNINNKIYIGLTTCTLKHRWQQHLTESRNLNNKRHLYQSMRKYGIENFSISAIAATTDFKELGKLERFYIRFYDSQNPEKGYNLTAGGETNQYDGNPSAKLTLDDVIQIREIYAMGELPSRECYKMYSDKISESGFHKVWCGITWEGILSEVYTNENIEIHKKHSVLIGSDNGKALLTTEEVLDIRKYYVNHSLTETFNKFGSKYNNLKSFRAVIDRSYKNIPIYKKRTKQWILDNKIIDIESYNPVSTISESGE